MADPLSMTASIVGITVPALHTVRLLINDLQQLRDAPKTVQQLRDDLASTSTAVASLEGIQDRDWEVLGGNITENTKTVLQQCQIACDSFRTDVQRWTRHSKDGKLSWQDRAAVGFFKDDRIKSMSGQLQNCKITITSIVSISVLYGSVRQGHTVGDIQNTLDAKQAEILRAVSATEKQLAALESQMSQLKLGAGDADRLTDTDNTAEAVQTLEGERKAVTASTKLLQELLLKSQKEELARVAAQNRGTVTTATFGSNNSGFQSGVINGSVSGISFGRQS